MKRLPIFLGGLLILVAISSLVYLGTRASGPVAKSGEIRVAAILSLTGPPAQFDAVKRQTLAVAQERLAAIHPGVVFNVEVYDAGSGADSAMIVARRAIRNGAQIILSGTSPNALAIASIVRTGDAPIVQLANAANPEFGPPYAREFRLWPDWNDEAREVINLARREGWDNVLLINSSDPYSTALEQALRAQMPRSTTLRQLTFDPASAPDFRPALIRANAAGTDAVVLFGLPPGMRALIGQLAEVRWSGAVVGGVNINLVRDDFRNAGLSAPLWSVRTTAMQETLPDAGEPAAYRARYVVRHREQPPFHALYFADGLYFTAAGAAIGGDATFNPEMLLRTRQFESASGPIAVAGGVFRYRVWTERLD